MLANHHHGLSTVHVAHMNVEDDDEFWFLALTELIILNFLWCHVTAKTD